MQEICRELDRTAERASADVQLMEVCGTHTVNAARSGVHSLVPENVRLV
ncbi:MAG: hydrogenase formation protein HypD, partial [Planctomycetota bacterium]